MQCIHSFKYAFMSKINIHNAMKDCAFDEKIIPDNCVNMEI